MNLNEELKTIHRCKKLLSEAYSVAFVTSIVGISAIYGKLMDCFLSFLSVAFAVFPVSFPPLLQAVSRRLAPIIEATTGVTFLNILLSSSLNVRVYLIELSIYLI